MSRNFALTRKMKIHLFGDSDPAFTVVKSKSKLNTSHGDA